MQKGISYFIQRNNICRGRIKL